MSQPHQPATNSPSIDTNPNPQELQQEVASGQYVIPSDRSAYLAFRESMRGTLERAERWARYLRRCAPAQGRLTSYGPLESPVWSNLLREFRRREPYDWVSTSTFADITQHIIQCSGFDFRIQPRQCPKPTVAMSDFVVKRDYNFPPGSNNFLQREQLFVASPHRFPGTIVAETPREAKERIFDHMKTCYDLNRHEPLGNLADMWAVLVVGKRVRFWKYNPGNRSKPLEPYVVDGQEEFSLQRDHVAISHKLYSILCDSHELQNPVRDPVHFPPPPPPVPPQPPQSGSSTSPVQFVNPSFLMG